jgi:hypothetical protein
MGVFAPDGKCHNITGSKNMRHVRSEESIMYDETVFIHLHSGFRQIQRLGISTTSTANKDNLSGKGLSTR